MTNFSIVRCGNTVYRDDEAGCDVDCSDLDPNIRTVYWNDVTDCGWIEYLDSTPTLVITELAVIYQDKITSCGVAHTIMDQVATLQVQLRAAADNGDTAAMTSIAAQIDALNSTSPDI